MRIDEAPEPVDGRHAVAFEVPLDARDLELADRVLAREELRDGEVRVQLDGEAVELASAGSPERKSAVSRSVFDGQRPRVDGRAARLLRALDERDALAEVRRLRRALLAGGTAAEDDQSKS